MRLYHRVYINEIPNGLIRFVRERMIKKDPLPLGKRWTSNIDHHISMRAGMFSDSKLVDVYGLVSLQRMGHPEKFIRMYGNDKGAN